jgi:glycosyltransferase involved in cell wall biosynthesis
MDFKGRNNIMRKIFINARFLSQQITGVQRYAIQLLKALDELLDSGVIDTKTYNFVALTPRNTKTEFKFKYISIKCIGKFRGHLWEQLELPLYTRRGLLLNLCNTGPLFKIRQVVMLHDASVYGFPNAYSFIFRVWYKFLLKGLGFISKKVLTNSVFSKNELVKYFGIKTEKIRVTYLGYNHIMDNKADESMLSRNGLENIKYALAVSSMNPNKNFASIVKAIALLENELIDLVIVGGSNQKVFGNFDFVSQNNVKFLGYVNDRELRTLYEHATCFIYPSYYEGFGLPPLEAMSLGCPVIVSNTASLPEVCGEAALYCNPSDPQDIADKIRLMMNNPELRDELRKKGMQQIKRYSWSECAYQTWKVIEECL